MSIVTEIERIRSGKRDIRNAVLKRGVYIDDRITIDDYASMIDRAPYVIKGEFTPEEDTDIFEISGMDFVAQSISVACVELDTNRIPSAIISAYSIKEYPGSIVFTSSAMDLTNASLQSNSSVVTWTDESVLIQIPSASKTAYFKKGYTYKYVVTGGIAQ